MQDYEGKESAFEMAWSVWSRRKWLAITVSLWIFAAVVSVAESLPDIYRSAATVLVEHHQVPESLVRPSVNSQLETRIDTISQKILSRERLTNIIGRFDLYPNLRTRVPLEAVVERMRRDIHVEFKRAQEMWGRGATVAFTVSYLGRDPRKVAAVTNAVASFYVEENLRIREQQATGAVEFFEAQLEEAKNRLDAQQRKISEFKMRHIGELPDQTPVNLATLERLNTQLKLNSDNQIRALEGRESLLKKLAEAKGAAGEASPGDLVPQLARLNQELAQLRTRFSDKYPDVIRVKGEIAALERQIAKARLNGGQEDISALPAHDQLSQALRAIENEIKLLKADEASIRRAIATYEERIETAPKRGQQLQDLSQGYQASKELYDSLLKRYEEAQLGENMEQRRKGEQFRILDPALPPRLPEAPNRFRLVLMGLFLALGVAAGATMLAELLDTSFHSVDELRSFTKVQLLAGIPRIVTDADARQRRWRLCLGAGAVILGLVVIIGASYFMAHENENLVRMLVRGRL